MREVPEARPMLSTLALVRRLSASTAAGWAFVSSAALLSNAATAILRTGFQVAAGLVRLGDACEQRATRLGKPRCPSGTENLLLQLDRVRHTLRQRHPQAAQLQDERELLQVAVSNIPVGVGMFDVSKRLIMCNPSYRDLYSVPDELTVPGTSLRAMLEHRVSLGNFEGDDKEAYVARLMTLVEEKDPLVRRTELADGRTIRIKQKQVDGVGWISMHEDITEAARAEAMVAHLARHDALTDLPNRVGLDERISDALARVKAGETAAILSIDLDHFKLVNDTLGHPIGDALLKAVAGRLRATVRQDDSIARFGGDEFVIVQVGVAQPQAAHALAQRIVDSLSRPFSIEGHDISIGASVGIAIAPTHGESAAELLKFADAALYCAKGGGRGRAHCFDPGARNSRSAA